MIVNRRFGAAQLGRPERLSVAGRLLIAVLLIVIFEGAFRKWISAGLTTPLVLMRDALALWMVVHAIQSRRLRFNRASGVWLSVWTVIVFAWSMIQAIVNETSFEIVAIGFRFWLLYLWFAVAAAVSITERDFRAVVKILFWLTVCMSPLVVLQYLQPPEAFINKQVGNAEDDLIFTVIAGVVRTTGTFSFTLGFSTFLALVTPFALTELTAKSELKKPWRVKALFLGSMLIATMVSGSRTAFVTFFILVVAYFAYLFVWSQVKIKLKTYATIAAGGVVMGLLAIIFSGALAAIEERATGAAESEDVELRILETVVGSDQLWDNFEFLGSGIGFGANFAGVVLTGERAFLHGENELERVLFSGGILGLLFVGLKMLLAAWGIFQASKIARRGSALPLLLWTSAALALLTWPITGQLTVNAMGFLIVGLALAAQRFPQVGSLR